MLVTLSKIEYAAKHTLGRRLTKQIYCFAVAGLLMTGFSSGAQQEVIARDLAPEIASKVWMEGNKEIASVTINGDELARFVSADEDDDDAAEEAENLAVKLSELVLKKDVDANQLMPSHDDEKSVIKLDGDKWLEFDSFAGQDGTNEKKKKDLAYEASLKMVNVLRFNLGACALPTDYPDVSDRNTIADRGPKFSGHASWYGGRFNGRRCSDGSRFSEEKLTAAHRTLPFGTRLLVRNRRTGDQCVVEVNDRGPFIDGRVIDVSRAAARQLNMVSSGVAMVDCLVLNDQ